MSKVAASPDLRHVRSRRTSGRSAYGRLGVERRRRVSVPGRQGRGIGRGSGVVAAGSAAAAVGGLADVEVVLSRLSFGALMASTGIYWFKAAFTDTFSFVDRGRRTATPSFSGTAEEEKEVPVASDGRPDVGSGVEVATLVAANVALVATLCYRWYDSGHFPLSNLYESLLFLGWGMTAVQLWLETQVSKSARAGGTVTLPGALLMVAFAALLLPPELQRSSSLVPALKSNWLTMHVTVIMMSYASLLVGSLLSSGYLLLDQPSNSVLGRVRDALPSFKASSAAGEASATAAADSQGLGEGKLDGRVSEALETADNLAYRSIGLGFAFLTVGIISGAVWANEAWGSYWSWDPKETWALITWLVYAMYLHSRLSLDWDRSDVAKLGSAGFLVVMTCYIGVNLWGVGLHSYGFFSK